MTALPKAKMTVDEFLAWAEGRSGRHELVDGEVFVMSPERARHAEVKAAAHAIMRQAVRSAGLNCHVLPDGMTVRINKRTAYEPDALVYCGARISGEAVEVPDPIIVVEVLSPSTGPHDTGAKLVGYFQVASVQHYLILDPTREVVIHHRRGASMIETRVVSAGQLALAPPGIEFAVEALFAED